MARPWNGAFMKIIMRPASIVAASEFSSRSQPTMRVSEKKTIVNMRFSSIAGKARDHMVRLMVFSCRSSRWATVAVIVFVFRGSCIAGDCTESAFVLKAESGLRCEKLRAVPSTSLRTG